MRGSSDTILRHAAKLIYAIMMNTLDRKGITLAYQEAGAGIPPVLLVHGFGCDHTFLDASAAIEASRVPIAYIGAASPMADVNRFRQLRPDLIVGQTIGSGHFSPLLVPDQINAMLERFIRDSQPTRRVGASIEQSESCVVNTTLAACEKPSCRRTSTKVQRVRKSTTILKIWTGSANNRTAFTNTLGSAPVSVLHETRNSF